MSFVNVGAGSINGNSDYPTKKALKDAIVANPEDVWFYGTSAVSGSPTFRGNATELVIGDKYCVVGPNPVTSRKWYATVEKTAKGIKVS